MALFQLSPIKQIELAAAKIPGAISLAQGIPSFQLHPEIRLFIEEQMRRGVCDRYSLTTGLQELREEVSLSLAAEGMHYDPDSEIICTVGSIEALAASLLGLTEPGDEVVLLSPTYTSYQGVVRMARCIPRFASLNEENNFDLDVDAIERAITSRTKIIFTCNPNNPTGTIFSRQATERLVQLALKHNLFILTDEVYKDFYFVDQPHSSPAHFPEVRNRVVRVFSFSKAFAMTGWRIGFLHTDRELLQRILPIHDAMVTCAPVASQYGALAALRLGEKVIAGYREEFRRRRDFVLSRLDRLSDLLDYQIPTASYFVFPRVKQTVPLAANSVELAYDILNRAKLALVPGSAFGPSGESHLRLSFGRDWPDLEQGCERLERYFRELPLTTSAGAHPSRKEQRSIERDIGGAVLRWSAKRYLERNKPLVLGILGGRGKTVFKRVLRDELSTLGPIRGGILSYNTDIGMPLSILNLDAPGQNLADKIRCVLEGARRGLLAQESAKILVLEYGVRSSDDAETLLSVRVPDYLILTDIFDPDSLVEGVQKFLEAVPAERIYWVDSPSLPAEIRSRLLPENVIRATAVENGIESYALAKAAATLCKERLQPTGSQSNRL